MLNPTSTPGPIAAILDAPVDALIARTLLTSPFWVSGLLKIFDFPAALGEAAHFGLQPAPLFALIVIVLQIVGSLAVILNRWTWSGAGALGVFTGLATLVGHAFWTIPDPAARFHDMNAFLANLGLIGGLVLAAVLSRPGRRR